jgi:hypothetical protein
MRRRDPDVGGAESASCLVRHGPAYAPTKAVITKYGYEKKFNIGSLRIESGGQPQRRAARDRGPLALTRGLTTPAPRAVPAQLTHIELHVTWARFSRTPNRPAERRKVEAQQRRRPRRDTGITGAAKAEANQGGRGVAPPAAALASCVRRTRALRRARTSARSLSPSLRGNGWQAPSSTQEGQGCGQCAGKRSAPVKHDAIEAL